MRFKPKFNPARSVTSFVCWAAITPMPVSAMLAFIMRIPSFFSTFAVVLCCSGCVPLTTRIGSQLAQTDPDYPQENPRVGHVIELYGTVPIGINLGLDAVYMAQHRPGCLMTPTYMTGAVSGAFAPLHLSLPLDIKRDGENFSAMVVVDKFVLGRCGWDLLKVNAKLTKHELQSLPGELLVKKPLLGMLGEANSENIPIIWRCRFNQLANLPKNYQAFACYTPEGERSVKKYKHTHLINVADRAVQAHFLDLDESESKSNQTLQRRASELRR